MPAQPASATSGLPPGRFRRPPPPPAATWPLAWPPPTTFNPIDRDRARPVRLPVPIIPRVNATAVSLRWIRVYTVPLHGAADADPRNHVPVNVGVDHHEVVDHYVRGLELQLPPMSLQPQLDAAVQFYRRKPPAGAFLLLLDLVDRRQLVLPLALPQQNRYPTQVVASNKMLPESRIYVMNVERSNAGINKAEDSDAGLTSGRKQWRRPTGKDILNQSQGEMRRRMG